jgi:hypothetical protein
LPSESKRPILVPGRIVVGVFCGVYDRVRFCNCDGRSGDGAYTLAPQVLIWQGITSLCPEGKTGTVLEFSGDVKRNDMQKQSSVVAERNLKILERDMRLDITVNELRILVGCLRALVYQMETDDEEYLDRDGRALKERLELLYTTALGQEAESPESRLPRGEAKA